MLLFPAIKHVQIMAVPVGDKSKLAAMTENGGKERERGREIRRERKRRSKMEREIEGEVARERIKNEMGE